MAKRNVALDGISLTIQDVAAIARDGATVFLSEEARSKMAASAALVAEWTSVDRVIYGVTTGFGDLASVAIDKNDVRTLQSNLLRSHACGLGDPFPEDVVRAIMALRINTLARGHSGIRVQTVELLCDMLNAGILPVIPSQGSVGASGDLCPLSHLGIALLGLGECVYDGKRMPTSEALSFCGLRPLELEAKEGLALNNGTAAMAAMGVLAAYDAGNVVRTADIAAAMSLEAMHGVTAAFDPRPHALRPHRGQGRVASNMRRLLAGSEILEQHKGTRVQDAYSLRCVPQVHGACRDAIDHVSGVLETEINSVTDNPLIFPEDQAVISQGNFHGEPLALAMDYFGIAAAEIASISERRQARLVDESLSGLPPFLVTGSGLNSGFMIPQYVSAALVSENKVLAHPSSVDSIPTSANQEDHVSMGAYSARKARTILENVVKVLGVELLTAAQALEFSMPLAPAPGTAAARDCVRGVAPFVERDTYLSPLMDAVCGLVRSGEVVRAVVERVGELD
jgi:histidine ammonia-lyase